MPVSAVEATRYFVEAGYVLLAITAEHAAATQTLPPIHVDPFDPMLLAQALTEPLKLLTHDEVVARYSDSTVLV
jgi:PIN domain nuclease of toxin-antitoxin system